jgi:molybdate transport system permease protein
VAGEYSVVFRFEGAVLAALVVALPMLYMPAKAAFASVDRDLEDAALTMGAGRLQVFWHVSIPLARRGLFSGLLLAFARALGEFGATLMVFGWQPGPVTLPISIYADYEQGDLAHATAAVVALSLISLALVLAYNVTLAKRD